MAYKVLLGRNFLTCPLLRISLSVDVEIEALEKTNANTEQVLSIEVAESYHADNELQVNPAVEIT